MLGNWDRIMAGQHQTECVELMPNESPSPNEALAAARQRLKTGRNEPCPCGSGRKYKKCCLAGDEELVRQAAPRLEPVPLPAMPVVPAPLSSAEPRAAETGQDTDFGPDAEAQEDESSLSLFGEHTQEVPGAPPEVDEQLKRVWDEFEKLPSPGLEEANALLEQLFRLPPEATLWSEVFHTLARHQPGQLPELFHRIAGSVPHAKNTGMGYFYWAAMEEFDRRGYRHLLPEVAAALRKLDVQSYSVEALDHMRYYLLNAGFDAELLAVGESYLPILRQDEELFDWVPPEWSHLVFEIRVGRLVEGGWGPDTPLESITRSLLAGIEEDTYPETANYLAAIVTGRAAPAAWTGQEFELTGKPVPKDKGPLAEHLLPLGTLLRVAQEAHQFDGIKPGCAFPMLMELFGTGEERDERGNKKKHLRSLLDFLRASHIDGRVARNTRDLVGFNVPKALMLLQAHELLLRAADRHQLLPMAEIAQTEAELARLRACLKPRLEPS